MLMMEMLADDRSYAEIVAALNAAGLRMRNGHPWNRIAVFKMVPRLIEVGPRFFSSEEWAGLHPIAPHQPPPAAPAPQPPARGWRTLFTRRSHGADR